MITEDEYEKIFILDKPMEIHPAALIMPPMNYDEYEKFKEDISGNGLLEPVIIFEDMVLDGRNRYRACTELEIDIPARLWECGMDAIEYVVSKNIHRRQLSSVQRSESAAKALTFWTDQAKDRQKESGGDRKSNNYKKIIEKSVPADLPEPINDIIVNHGNKPINKDNIANEDNIPASNDSKIEKASKAANAFSEWDNKNNKTKKDVGDARDKAAEMFGVSGRSVSDAKKILDVGTEEEKQTLSEGKTGVSTIANKVREREKLTPKKVSKFNKTNDSVSWAKWTWNPVTGCLHDCKYCYARDIANHYPQAFPNGFKPTFIEERLSAPINTKIPISDDDGLKRVFVCSMADLFGEWVEREWIDKVIEACKKNSEWTYVFLTKNPKRLIDIDWPENAWVGMTVDNQERADVSKEHLIKLNNSPARPSVIFISCEPLLSDVTFDGTLSNCDLVIIGGCSASSGMKANQPEWEWVENLHFEARKADCKIYWKPNLTVKPQEIP